MKNYSINNLPQVSIVIPCRNEEKFIGVCLDSIIDNDYPKDKLEILIVDGMSTDGTRKVIEKYSSKYQFIKVIDNTKMIIPAAMNIGINNSKGEVIMKMDGHATYEIAYISKCVRYLYEYNADNVGGIWKVMPRVDTLTCKAIAQVLIQPFGSGNAYIKIGVDEPRWTDSVSFGCFRKGTFDKIGLFNENLIRASDMDFNKRIKKNGGKILLVPDIVNEYYCDADFKASWKHNFSDGVWTTHVLKYGSWAFSFRHLVPFIFVLSLIGSALISFFYHPFIWLFLFITVIYFFSTIMASVKIYFRGNEKDIRFLFLLPVAFFVRHFAHGIGALYGILKPINSVI